MLTLFNFDTAFEIKGSVNPRNELVLDHFAVTFPVLAIFDRAALKVTATAVDENCDEKDGIEIRDSGRPSDDNTPTKGHHPIGNIVLDECMSTMFTTGKRSITGLREYFHHPLTRSRLLSRQFRITI